MAQDEIKFKKFISFLKENDCLDNFRKNWYEKERFYTTKYPCVNSNLKKYMFRNAFSYKDIFTDSFEWEITKEGYFFWSNISSKWSERI